MANAFLWNISIFLAEIVTIVHKEMLLGKNIVGWLLANKNVKDVSYNFKQ
jgi:hypothetical protein